MTNLDTIKTEAVKRFEEKFCFVGDSGKYHLLSDWTPHYSEEPIAEDIKEFILSEIDRAVVEAKLEAAEEIWQAIDAGFEKFKIDVAMRPIINKYNDDLLQKLSTLKEK